MSRLSIVTKSRAQQVVEGLYKNLEQRIVASPPGLCPVDISHAFLQLGHAQTCVKRTPCRIGLGQMGNLMEDILEGRGSMATIDTLEKTARVVYETADCAIGYEAAHMILKGLAGFRDDFEEHVTHNRCICHLDQPVPCVALCPAGVDIPGYLALVGEGRHQDAVRLIRKDNPFVTACAMVCEHPCEARCHQNMVDSSVNIRGIKRYAIEHAVDVPVPDNAASTGKRIAIIGGGPSGLSAAYYLQLMGHQTAVFEQRDVLVGMLRYGIPGYRLPESNLDGDINAILSTGVECHLNTPIGGENGIPLDTLQKNYDAVYIAIGAHKDKKIGIDGDDGPDVISAVDMLRDIGEGLMTDFTGKTVMVIGGGNVAMDVSRTAIRLGADQVGVVYRRRKADMTALPDEIEGAEAEGVQILELHAPKFIERDAAGHVSTIWADPKVIGLMDAAGRPSPADSTEDTVAIPCDTIIVAIGQEIDSNHFAEGGLPVARCSLVTDAAGAVVGFPGVYAVGDCATGPATVIKAVATGKVVAANIDNYLGFHHAITCDVEIPAPRMRYLPACGRVTMKERNANGRRQDFEQVEYVMTCQEAKQESSRCLRCDHFGISALKGWSVNQW
ncbi:NAD(P)-binding protein [Eubacterium aggregans]|uniref:NAD(P)-binding protein n=1 Tax=Eubacterium aggregans TaxID=81409 RepID=UPI003F32C224